MNFETYAGESNAFVHEVAEALGNPADDHRAMRLTRSVLHTLRDVISPEESLQLVSQLPLCIKGVYVDGWKLHRQDKIRTRPAFMEALRRNADRPEADLASDEEAEEAVKAVFQVLQNRVSTGELIHVIGQFPKELAGLWATPVR